jgi:hypothetical protein
MHAGWHDAWNQPASPVSKIAHLLSECGCTVTIDVTRWQPYSSSHLSSITNGPTRVMQPPDREDSGSEEI